jgi:spore coat polysaccharide biosynthesis protein SpsF
LAISFAKLLKLLSVIPKMSKRVVLIIQARMGSTRLPGKSMMDLAGKPLVGRILERVSRCNLVDEIVLAIPNTAENKCLEELCENYCAKVFKGSEDNLLDRYYQAAMHFGAEVIGRLPADNPVPEPSEIDRAFQHYQQNGCKGFCSNLAEINNSGYPDGIGVEVFNMDLLERAIQSNPTTEQREHIHLNFYNYESGNVVNPGWCLVETITCPEEIKRPDLVLDVNTKEQYLYMKQLYESLYPVNPEFSIKDVIKWHDKYYAFTSQVG